MESNDLAEKRNSSLVRYELTDEIMENQFVYNDSLTCGDKSKHQLQDTHEVLKEIQTAEDNNDSVKLKFDFFKSSRYNSIRNQSECILPERSISSFNNHKILSQQSSQREDTENTDCNENEEENMMEAVCRANNVEIVLTPRSQTKNMQTHCSGIVPNLQIQVEESVENINLNKHTKKSLKSKKKLHSSSIIDEPIKVSLLNTGKRKRRKLPGRLKASNSKSTVTTRETMFSDKKNERRKFKKQKSLDTISVLQTPHLRKRINNSKLRETNNSNSKDFVEIYHNNALKSGSFTVVSSRPSKSKPTQISEQLVEEIVEMNVDDEPKKDFFIPEKSIECLLPTEIETKTEDLIKNTDQNECQIQTDAYYQPGFYDNFGQRNYELPTMASKMKQVDRQLYHRFNIRHIPFVVGTSISPSHNLGLNIQQVLSIIKTKQPSIPGINPVLIRSVSKGVRPVSTLFEHISNDFAKSCRALNIQDFGRNSKNNIRINQGVNSISYESLRTNNLSTLSNQAPFKPFTCEPLYEEEEETHSVYSSVRNHIDPRKATTIDNRLESSMSKCQQQSHYSLEKQPRSHGQQYAKSFYGDLNRNMPTHISDKETIQVFSRLYDQFNKMITQNEKLKEQLEQRKDKALIKEVSEMEEAIKVKEQEITTVVNLYKEVQSLKKQMRLQHERNSFVCITTQESGGFNHLVNPRLTKFQRRAQTEASLDCKSSKLFPNRSGFIVHEAPHGLRLTGLLRQIQAFQRQLIMA